MKRELKCVLVMLAWFLGIQAFAKSGTLRFEDFLLRDSSHVIHGALSNGFQYYIIKEAQNPFQMSLVQNTGSQNDGETIEISHFLEHMMMTANRQIATGDTLRSYLNKLGKDYASGFNAYTTYNYMRFDLFGLKSYQSYADSCMELLADIASSASICAMDIEEQRERLINEVSNRKYYSTSKQADAREAVLMMGYTPEEWREMRLNSAKKITQSQLEEFYNKWFRPQYQCLLVTGNVPDGIEDMIKRKFGKHPRITAPSSTIINRSNRDLLIERYGNASCTLTLNFALPLLTQAEKESPNFFRDYYTLKKINGAILEKMIKNKHANINCLSHYQVADRLMLTMAFAYNLNEELSGGGVQAFVDSVAAFIDDLRSNGVQISMPKDVLKKSEVVLRRAQAMKKLQEGDGKSNTIDAFLNPGTCFVYSLPLYKQEDSDAYWSFVLSGKDISNYCKNFINKSKITIECVLPYDYPEKEITEKLNALLRH